MPRAMVFIDGTWLRVNTPRMAAEEGLEPKTYRMHFGRLLDEIRELVARSKELRVDPEGIDIVRAYIFGHIPINVDDRDKFEAEAYEGFYDIVEKEFGYDVELIPIDYNGRRLRAADRFREDPDDDWVPKEKRVDVALASCMLYYAAIPYAYDIAIAIIGDEDFVPVLQRVRSLGRRVAIVSIRTKHNSPCSSVYSGEYDDEGVRDFDVFWLNDLAKKIQIPERIIECEDPEHVGSRKSVTTALYVEGRREICDDCRERSRRARREERASLMEKLSEIEKRGWLESGGLACGVVAKVGKGKRGEFGFIRTRLRGQVRDYYFDQRDLAEGVGWDSISFLDMLVFRPEVTPPDRFNAREVRRPADSDWVK